MMLADETAAAERAATRERFAPIYRVALVRDGRLRYQDERPRVGSPEGAARVACAALADAAEERFVAILLDSKLKTIGVVTISTGILNQSLVHAREAFRPALLHNASSVVFAHNHPSGDVTPSAEDKVVAGKLEQAGKLLGIEMTDFLVVDPPTGNYWSMRG